jgi:hypothetical protein
MGQQTVSVADIGTMAPVLQSLGQFYAFRRPGMVARFLDTHPFLIPFLEEARSRIEECFGAQSHVVLEAVNDREAQGATKLFGYIMTSLAPEEAGKRLRQFDRQWFLPQIHRVNGLLNFDLEFQ